jgi:hypothetical protein
LDAAQYLVGALPPRGGCVLIVTGFYILDPGAPETDGPPGAAALAAAIKAAGHTPVLVTDPW